MVGGLSGVKFMHSVADMGRSAGAGTTAQRSPPSSTHLIQNSNALLQEKGYVMPKMLKTGTTIAGVVFKVRGGGESV